MDSFDDPDDEALKQEIWAEVARTRAEREAKEKEERKRRALANKRNKKPEVVAPVIIEDSEASEKLLEQRRKREEDRKRLAQLRTQGKQQQRSNDVDVEIAVSSPVKSDPPISVASTSNARRIQPETTPPSNDSTPTARNSNAFSSPTPQSSSFRSSQTQTRSSIEEVESNESEEQKWKQAYEKIKNRLEAELAGKKNLEQVLAQYANTIDSLMMEQENQGSEDTSELRQENNELKSELKAKNAELAALSDAHQSLLKEFKDVKKQLEASNNDHLLQQIQTLQSQLQMAQSKASNGSSAGYSEKLAEFRAASSQQIQVLKLKCAKLESRVTSLQTELNAKTQENAKLTEISDTLVAMLESVKLED